MGYKMALLCVRLYNLKMRLQLFVLFESTRLYFVVKYECSKSMLCILDAVFT